MSRHCSGDNLDEVGIMRITVFAEVCQRWIDLLCFKVTPVAPWVKNFQKIFVKIPKIFFKFCIQFSVF